MPRSPTSSKAAATCNEDKEVRVLIDSHVFVWALLDDPRLSAKAKNVLRSDKHELFFSLASLWELSIKIRLGKLRTLTSSVAFVQDSLKANGIAVLPLRYEDILSLEHLPGHHRDPFDRMLIAQAIANDLQLLTEDAAIGLYESVSTLW